MWTLSPRDSAPRCTLRASDRATWTDWRHVDLTVRSLLSAETRAQDHQAHDEEHHSGDVAAVALEPVP
jgi:hypothetical protein